MTEAIALPALTALLFFALIATLAFGDVYDTRKQLESEDSPPSADMLDGYRSINWMLAVGALFIGLLALWGGE